MVYNRILCITIEVPETAYYVKHLGIMYVVNSIALQGEEVVSATKERACTMPTKIIKINTFTVTKWDKIRFYLDLIGIKLYSIYNIYTYYYRYVLSIGIDLRNHTNSPDMAGIDEASPL